MSTILVIPKDNEVRILTLDYVSKDYHTMTFLDLYRGERIVQLSPKPGHNIGRHDEIKKIGTKFFTVKFTVTSDKYGIPDANFFAPVPDFESYTVPHQEPDESVQTALRSASLSSI